MDSWNTSFLLGWPIFRGYFLVSGSVTSLRFNVFLSVFQCTQMSNLYLMYGQNFRMQKYVYIYIYVLEFISPSGWRIHPTNTSPFAPTQYPVHHLVVLEIMQQTNKQSKHKHKHKDKHKHKTQQNKTKQNKTKQGGSLLIN